NLKLWDLTTGKETATLQVSTAMGQFTGHQLEWLADGTTLVVRQGTALELWDTTSGKKKESFLLAEPQTPVAAPRPADKTSTTVPQRPADKKASTPAPGAEQTSTARASALSADGARLAVLVGSVNRAVDPPTKENEVILWDVAKRRRCGVLKLPGEPY